MKKEKNKGNYTQNPKGYYNVNLTLRGIRCNVKIINESYNKFKLEVQSKKILSDDFLKFIGEYLENEGFNEEARKHNLEWNV
jgi:hypothetical protein